MRRLILLLALFVASAGPAQAALLFTDDFNRADSAIVGNNWTEDLTSMGIVSNQLGCDGSCAATGPDIFNTVTLSTNDYVVSGKDAATAAATSQVMCRMSTGGQASLSAYSAVFEAGDGSYRINEWASGSSAQLATSATGLTKGANIALFCNGTSLRAYNDGSEIASATDATVTTGQPGVFDNIHGAATAILDNFAACNAVAECNNYATTGIGAAAGGPSGRDFFRIGQ